MPTPGASAWKGNWGCWPAWKIMCSPHPPPTPIPLDAVEFFQKTEVDALAISYGTMHGASKGKDVKLRKEIAVATAPSQTRAQKYIGVLAHTENIFQCKVSRLVSESKPNHQQHGDHNKIVIQMV